MCQITLSSLSIGYRVKGGDKVVARGVDVALRAGERFHPFPSATV